MGRYSTGNFSGHAARCRHWAACGFGCVIAAAFGESASAQVFYGPTPYLCASDSPFADLGLGGSIVLEDFEDGELSTAGVTTNATVYTGFGEDSVDCDDGMIDGDGSSGYSVVAFGAIGVRFDFDAAVLGGFPTHAGLVWTDGSTLNNVVFEAFDAGGVSLGTIVAGDLSDSSFFGTTDEDRFLGVVHAGGISAINVIDNPMGNGNQMEVDHLQFGFDCTVESSIVQQGTADPLLSGWTKSGQGLGVISVSNASDSSWAVADELDIVGSSLLFHRSPDACQRSLADAFGWTLAAELTVQSRPDQADGSIIVSYDDGVVGFSMVFGATETGDPRMELQVGMTGEACPEPIGIEYQASGIVPHLYELVYDPGSGTANLFVDGASQGAAYLGHTLDVGHDGGDVIFGSHSDCTTGYANYHRVEWTPNGEAPPGDFDCDGGIGLGDVAEFLDCFSGPVPFALSACCGQAHIDGDADADLADFARLQRVFGAP